MGGFASALQGMGSVSEDLASGKQTFEDWKRQQAMDKLNLFASQTKLKQLLESMKQANLPQSLGFTTGPNGEQLAITREPNTGAISTKQIVAGFDPAKLQVQANQLISSLPESIRPIGKGLFDMYSNAGDVMSGVKALSGLAEKAGSVEKGDTIKAEGDIPYQITDAQGRSWDVNDPALPQDLKKLVDNYKAAAEEKRKRTIEDETRKNVEALNRAIEVGDAREAQKQRDAVFTQAKRGIAGHSFLQSVQTQVESAARTGGQGTTAGDMLLIEGFMQLYFGIDPKALRGSPKMMEIMLKQGGWDDRAIAAMNGVLTGGKLSQDVREDILQKSKQQIQSWDAAVGMAGQLTDDPKVKTMVDHYFRAVGGDASDLGGTKE